MVWGRVVGSRSPHTQVGSYRLGRCVGFTTSWLLRVLKEETHCINYKRKFHFQIIVQHERNFAILLCIEARIDPEWFRVEMLLNFAVCILQHWHTMIVRWGDTMCFIDISFSKTKFSLEMSHQCCVRNSFFLPVLSNNSTQHHPLFAPKKISAHSSCFLLVLCWTSYV